MGCWSPRLTAPGLDDLVLSPENGWMVALVDIGSPVIAEVMTGRPGADGNIDTSAFHRDRPVTLQAFLVPDDQIVRRSMLDELKQFLRPGLRPYLILTEDESDLTERRVRLRVSQWSDPIGPENFRRVQVSWVAPDGIVEANVEQTAIAYPSGSGAEVGRAYDLAFDRTYPGSPVIGATQVLNGGNVDVWPVFRVFGACTDPNIENQTTGKALEFNSLTIAAGDYMEIDTRAKTVRLNGLSTSSLYDKLDFTVSAPGLDLRIVPGLNLFQFSPATAGPTCELQIIWRDAWI